MKYYPIILLLVCTAVAATNHTTNSTANTSTTTFTLVTTTQFCLPSDEFKMIQTLKSILKDKCPADTVSVLNQSVKNVRGDESSEKLSTCQDPCAYQPLEQEQQTNDQQYYTAQQYQQDDEQGSVGGCDEELTCGESYSDIVVFEDGEQDYFEWPLKDSAYFTNWMPPLRSSWQYGGYDARGY